MNSRKVYLLEDLKMPEDLSTLPNFNFLIIYIIHKILLLLELKNYIKNTIFKRFKRSMLDYF